MNERGQPAHRGKIISNAEFAKLWLSDSITTDQIGVMLGISGAAVRCRADARGLPPRIGGLAIRKRLITDPEFPKMWQAGVSRADLCCLYGCKSSRITRTVRRLGLAPRKASRHAALSLAAYRMQCAAAMTHAAMIEAGMASPSGRRAM